MRDPKYMVSGLGRIKVLCLLVLMQTACSSASKESDSVDWVGLNYLIDGMIEIQLKVPPARTGNELNKMQFIGTKVDSSPSLFMASYDSGKGKNRGFFLTHISGIVVRVERENDDTGGLSLEDIKNEIYLSRPDAVDDFSFIGEKTFTGRSWLGVDLIGGSRTGIAYSSPIHKNYVLILAVSMFDQDSNKTRLFKKRQETLEQILTTVQVSTVDF